MSGPRHLWSGDWESDSARAGESLANAPGPVHETEPEPGPQPGNTRRWGRRQLAIALATGVAAAAVTVGLVTALAGSSKPAAHHAAAATTHSATNPQRPTGGRAPIQVCQRNPTVCTKATPVVSGPTADWLGMQIVTSPAGIVINTIQLGSEADLAGFEPGDRIARIDDHEIDSIDQIRRVAAKVRLGKPVVIAVLRSSVPVPAASLPMTERPTIHP